ncbi:hypothetical protein GCM10018783_31420 [Streptomyces griseosporeus]|nr:hypothetical protein GCM10018783_31420 [Streptomyces griseosporeus]
MSYRSDMTNVSKIYAKGDAIQGQLKKEQKNPDGDGSYTSSRRNGRPSPTTGSGRT